MSLPIITHPFEPFLPPEARVLIMGTFPPDASRWSMPFYYPNRINDFWRIIGLIFFNNRDHFLTPDLRAFDMPRVKQWAYTTGVAFNDTGLRVRRLRGNASDKYLDIVEPRQLAPLLEQMPQCLTVATTGEKAADIIALQTATKAPRMGGFVTTRFAGRELTLTRMPSTSRAYPLALARKADYYALLFQQAGILKP